MEIGLIAYVAYPLQAEDLPCLIGGGWFTPEFLYDSDHLRHLLSVALGHLSLLQIEVVFQADSAIPADEHRLGADGKLGASGHTYGKLEVPDQFLGGVHKEHQVFGGSGNAPQDAHDELDVHGLLDVASLNKESHVIDHPRVVDFELRFRVHCVEDVAILAQGLKGIREDEVLGHGEHRFRACSEVVKVLWTETVGKSQMQLVDEGPIRGSVVYA